MVPLDVFVAGELPHATTVMATATIAASMAQRAFQFIPKSLLFPGGSGNPTLAGHPFFHLQAVLKVTRLTADALSRRMPRGTSSRSTPARPASVARASRATRNAPATSLE